MEPEVDAESSTGTPPVHVYVASLNTAAATELCIRSMRACTDLDFALTVGDAGSTDGSLAMLRRFEQLGWLELQVAEHGRRHSEWLNQWVGECPSPYAVFVDSDVVFRRHGWLEELVATARDTGSVFVSAGILHPSFPPTDAQGRKLRWMPRPTPWMMLVDVERARATEVGFGFRTGDDPDAGVRVMYDTGAAFFEAVERRGDPWAAMPAEWGRCFHHFGSLSWWSTKSDLKLRGKVKLRLKRLYVSSWLLRVRLAEHRRAVTTRLRRQAAVPGAARSAR
jgi:hypothetical protein